MNGKQRCKAAFFCKMEAGRQREGCRVMVEPNCVTDEEGQCCLCGSSAFCSPVRDGDCSEPEAERQQWLLS